MASLDLTQVNNQLTKLRARMGEPVDAAQARFDPDTLLEFLNEARRTVAEETWCFPLADSQTVGITTSGQPCFVSVPNDLIMISRLEYDGRPLRFVTSFDWRDVIGADDSISGDPAVAKYFARRFQLFPTVSTAGKSLAYEGRGYPQDLSLNGVEPSLVESAIDATIWQAAADALGADERNNSYQFAKATSKKASLEKQYKPKGPRYVRTGDLYLPWRPML